jgi:tRNA(fMet)-specific endonuclease VapC
LGRGGRPASSIAWSAAGKGNRSSARRSRRSNGGPSCEPPHLLDTNAAIGVLNGRAPRVVARLEALEPGRVCLAAIVKAELLHGARRSRRVEENLGLLREFFAPFASLPFDDRCAEHYATIRTELEAPGTPIAANDLLLAATARAYDLALVTHNVRQFSRVTGLRIEDWEAD